MPMNNATFERITRPQRRQLTFGCWISSTSDSCTARRFLRFGIASRFFELFGAIERIQHLAAWLCGDAAFLRLGEVD